MKSMAEKFSRNLSGSEVFEPEGFYKELPQMLREFDSDERNSRSDVDPESNSADADQRLRFSDGSKLELSNPRQAAFPAFWDVV